MKILFTIILTFLFFTNSFSNDWKVIIDSKFVDWKDIEVELSHTEKEKLLESFYELEMFKALKDHELVTKSNFHFVHLNEDKLVDIVYSGYARTESNRTIFLQNTGSSFKILIDLFGEIATLEKNLNNKSLKFYILNYPCCAGYTYHIESYSYYYQTNNLLLDTKVAFIEGTIFPEKKTIDKNFETVHELYRLRTSPVIDNKIPDKYSTPHEGVGNIVAEFDKGTKGKAIAESTDETGRVWWFVIISKQSKTESSIFHNGDNTEESYEFAGWMSSRYVKEL
jgi:hypothetical protein